MQPESEDVATEPDSRASFKEQRDALPTEELRLALVLNGGVSLAVWMGGVAHEIDRLTRSDQTRQGADEAYGAILGAARTTVVVDVISGTSAGGINGAALALAQANRNADLRTLRNLWAEQGRMEELLRRPFQGAPTSLLQGDDYFLPELHRAMQILARSYQAPPKVPQIDLTLTTTLLKGGQDVTVDDFGQVIPQRIHASTFHFSNVGDGGQPPAPEQDGFSGQNIRETARALALAARCTASFPFAFEPSFVPVGEPGDNLRPDMRRYASWYPDDGGVHSRYAVDGGLLANTPLTHALDAIARRHADGPVRRSMLMVFPHAPEAADVPPDEAATPPTTAGSMGGVLGALLAQGSRSFVERIKEHNQAAAEWQGSREQILTGLGADDPVEALYAVLRTSWPHYRHIRTRYAARGLADRVGNKEHWSYDRIRETAESAQRHWFAQHGHLPYVPSGFLRGPESETGTVEYRPWQEDYLDKDRGWRWGDSAAVGVADAAAAVLRAALAVTSESSEGTFAQARGRVGQAAAAIANERTEVDEVWLTNPYLRDLEPNRDYWVARILAYQRAMQPRTGAQRLRDHALLETLLPTHPGREADRDKAIEKLVDRDGAHGRRVWAEVEQVAQQISDVRHRLVAATATSAGPASGLGPWVGFLFGPKRDDEPAGETERIVLRLLALDAGTRLLSDGTAVGANLPVQFGELSLRVEHPWARFSVTPDDKAAGLELSRFGGFLKRSWRMNDWTWGRLDAAAMLCQTVLDPRRLRRMAAMLDRGDDVADEMFELLQRELYQGARLPARHESLEVAARADLRSALDPACDLRHLPALATWAALPLQADIILEELPILAAAVKVDKDEGAGFPTRGTRFLLDHDALLKEIGTTGRRDDEEATQRLERGLRSLHAFDSAGIGRERLDEETGSNALIRTASNAASVLATVIDADAARIAPALRPLTSAVRGAMMIPHWVVTGLTSGGTIARFLATAGLVVGGLLLTLSLLGVLGGLAPAAGLVGAATILAAFAYSALKTGSLLHACALLAPVVPLTAFALDTTSDDSGWDAATRVLIVLGAVAALYVLGNLPWPLFSPFDNAKRAWNRLDKAVRRAGTWLRDRRRAVLLVLLGALAAGAALWAVLRTVLDPLTTAAEWVAEQLRTDVGVAVGFGVVLAVGGVLATRQGRKLRPWHSDPTVETTFTPRTVIGAFTRKPVDHPSGVAASWAPVYGSFYFVVAWVSFVQGWPAANAERWQQVTFWWLASVGIVLCLVAPPVTGRLARARIEQGVRQRWPDVVRERAALAPSPPGTAARPILLLEDQTRAGRRAARIQEGVQHQWPDAVRDCWPLAPSPSGPSSLLYLLLKYDTAYSYLLRTEEPTRPGRRPTEGSELRLTRRGESLLHRLQASQESTDDRDDAPGTRQEGRGPGRGRSGGGGSKFPKQSRRDVDHQPPPGAAAEAGRRRR